MSRQWGDGRYEARGLLGRGGSAEVWRCTDRPLHREVAIKSFVGGPSIGSIGGAQDAARFRAEIQMLARLDHPHVIRILDAGIEGDEPWYAMHLADAGSLARPDAARPAPELGRVGVHIADALDYVHSRGIVHRDVKPSNILLTGERHTYLADFGVARVTDASRVTRAGLLVGTVAFLAPEQVRGEVVGPPADVYALGLVLLERLTGRREYGGPPAEAAVARLVRPPVVPPTLPAEWIGLLSAMTSADPTDRPGAAEVRDRLARSAPDGEPSRLVVRVSSPVRSSPVSAAPALLPTSAGLSVTAAALPMTAALPLTTSLRSGRPVRPARSTGLAALGGALAGGGLVALFLTGGILGPLRLTPGDRNPDATDRAEPRIVAQVSGTTPTPSPSHPHAVGTNRADPRSAAPTPESTATPAQGLLSTSVWDAPFLGALEDRANRASGSTAGSDGPSAGSASDGDHDHDRAGDDEDDRDSTERTGDDHDEKDGHDRAGDEDKDDRDSTDRTGDDDEADHDEADHDEDKDESDSTDRTGDDHDGTGDG